MKPTAVALFLASSFFLVSAAVLAESDPGLTSGGLAPPPPVESEPSDVGLTPTERELERADREDSGRGLKFVWVNAEVGYQFLGLQTFHANDLVDAQVVPSTENGLVVGAGLGLRLIFLTAGARFRLGHFESFQVWTLNAELGFRVPIGRFEPYFTFGGGYAALGSFDSAGLRGAFGESGGEASGLSVRGFNLRGGAGLDYFVGRTLSVGANLSGDLLFLSRPRVRGVETTGESDAAARIYAQDGSAVGGSATLMAVVGLHF